MLFFLITTILVHSNIWFNITKHLATAPIGDKGTNLWNLWWVYYAVFERFQSPLWCDLIFYPWGLDLRHHTLSISNGLLAAPLTAFVGANVAYNVLYLVWTFLTGVFASLWARMFQINLVGALLVGFWAAFGPFRIEHAIHLNLFSTHWMFLCFWFIERGIQNQQSIDWVGFGVSWLLTMFASFYLGLFVGGYWGLRLVVHVWFNRRTLNKTNFLYTLLAGLLVCCTLLLYFNVSINGENRLDESMVDEVSLQYAVYWSLDFYHLLLPAWIMNWYGLTPVESEFNIHPGLGLTLLFLLGLVVLKTWQIKRELCFFVIIATLGFLVLSLGPIMKVGSGIMEIVGLPLFLPAFVLEFVPKLTSIRVFSRFAYVGFVLMSIIAAYGLSQMLSSPNQWIRRFVLGGLLVYLVIYGYNIKLQMVDFDQVQSSRITSDTSMAFIDGPILVLPFEPTILSGVHLYHQTYHQQPIYVAEFSRLGEYRRRYLDRYSILLELNDVICDQEKLQTLIQEKCELIKALNVSALYIGCGDKLIDESDQISDQKLCNGLQLEYYDLEAWVKKVQ